jgi:hypothetical protein
MTLIEFLLARIAEDEAAAQYALTRGGGGTLEYGGQWYGAIKHAERWEPARVLVECEKNRQIVALHESWPTLVETPLETETTDDISGYVLRASKQIAWLTTREYVARFGIDPPTAPILALLALPYADHPDYQPEWKP